MNTTAHESAFALRCCGDADLPPLLEGVIASGRLDGVLFTMTLRQTYRNAGTAPVELLYTFPLPHEAVLLGIAAEFGDHRLEGQVLPSQQAEAVYEEALAEGDAPVLLEVTADGLHTASLGNLLPDERVVLEVRFAQVLAFDQGRLRLVVPTTIAPRYGNAGAAAVAPHQMPEASLAVAYSLALDVTVTGSLANGGIECPTHACRVARTDQGLRLDLVDGARLDRDVVLVVQPVEPRSDLLVTGRDGGGRVVALAAFQVPPCPLRESISLALLVDCSGSMGGDSMASARRALHGLAMTLGPQDRVSLSRFGSHVEHMLTPALHTPPSQDFMRRLIEGTDASMGGTEMAQALRSVFALWPPSTGADVLLITDGEIWNVDELVASARQGNHRVFAIGVGSAPAEGVLRRLAEATGGACEFATPGESLHGAVLRMVGRIRQVVRQGVRVDWGVQPAWEVASCGVFSGDTFLAWAGFDQTEPVRPRLDAPHKCTPAAGQPASVDEQPRAAAVVASAGTDLGRIAAWRRLETVDEKLSLQLALDHQLVTRQTHCVLVHRRAEDDKPLQPAEVRKLPQMLAAGWGATSPVHRLPDMMCATDHFKALESRTVWRSGRTASPWVDGPGALDLEEVEIPAFLRRQVDPAAVMPLEDIAKEVATHLEGGGSLSDLPRLCAAWMLPESVRRVVAELAAEGVAEAHAWLMLAAWIVEQSPLVRGMTASRMRLTPLVDAIDPTMRRKAWATIVRHLGSPAEKPESGRLGRLWQALR